MEKKYIYRKHLRKPIKGFLIMGLLFIITYAICSVTMILSIKDIDRTQLVQTILLVGIATVGIISLEFTFIYFIMYRRFKKIHFTLTEEGIIYNNAKGEIKIPYENIISLKFPSIKYTGGWVKIIHPNGKIRITVVLENIGDMIKTLKNKLDEKNMSNIYDEKGMYKFFKTAEYSDQSWERIYEKVKFIMIFILLNLGVSAIFSGFITNILVKFILLIGSIVGALIPYLITEIIIGRKLAKGASKEGFTVPERNKTFENGIYKWCFGIYAIIYFIILIIIYSA